MKRVLLTAVVLLLLLMPKAQGQGFGTFQKKNVTIERLLPPTVNLKGKKIRVEATADAVQKDGGQLRDLLRTKLVTLIQKDPRFILNDTSPQTVLHFSITNFYMEKYAVGTGANQKTNIRGKIEVAYQAIDVATGSALDSENLTDTAGYDPGNPIASILHPDKEKVRAAGSENETRDQLVTGIVNEMGKRIAPLDQPFVAPLPGGKLEPLSALAQSGRWGALETQAEKTDPLLKANEDTYRLYLIALSKEAQAYDLTREANERDLGKRNDITAVQADAEFHRAQKYLDEAAATYKQIITTNPKEKEFRPGDTRTEEALAIYAKIERFKIESAKAIAAKVVVQTPVPGKAAPPSMDNSVAQTSPLDRVLDFCHRGLAVDSIKEYIDSPDFLADAKASKYKFNFGSDPIKLNEACSQNAAVLQREMRLRLKVPSAAPRK